MELLHLIVFIRGCHLYSEGSRHVGIAPHSSCDSLNQCRETVISNFFKVFFKLRPSAALDLLYVYLEPRKKSTQWSLLLCKIQMVHGQVTIIFVVSVGLSVCLFVQSFSQPSSIQFRSNQDMLYVWVQLCPLEYRGCATPGGWVTPKNLFLGVWGLKKLSCPTVLIRLSWFLVLLQNAPILKFLGAIFCNFHLQPKL